MSNDWEKDLLRHQNSSLGTEVSQMRTESELLQMELVLANDAKGNWRASAQRNAKRIQELEAALAEAQATITRKSELLVKWMASQTAYKTLAITLRKEGEAHPDKEAHPLANSQDMRKQLLDVEYERALQAIKDGTFQQ